MSAKGLTADALALPLEERAALAQALWESIERDLPSSGDPENATREAIRRGEELSSGAVIGEAHEDVMAAMRRAA